MISNRVCLCALYEQLVFSKNEQSLREKVYQTKYIAKRLLVLSSLLYSHDSVVRRFLSTEDFTTTFVSGVKREEDLYLFLA